MDDVRQAMDAVWEAVAEVQRRQAKVLALLTQTTEASDPCAVEVSVAAVAYHVPPYLIMSRSRLRPHCDARHQVWWMLRHKHGWTMPQIARRFRRNAHGSVLHGIRKHQDRIDTKQVSA